MNTKRLKLKVTKIQRPFPGVARLTLQPIGREVPVYRAGQFLTFIFENLGTKEVRRSYSLSSTYGIDEQMEVTIKQQANGAASTFLTTQVEVGEELLALEPAGQFVLPPQANQKHYIMLAAGSGITPVFSLIKAILSHHTNANILLLYANRDEDHIIFRDEIMTWQRQYAQRLRCLHLLSNKKGNIDLTDKGQLHTNIWSGRLSNIFLEDYLEANWRFSTRQTEIYLCGPRGFMLKAANTLRFMEFPEDQIHQEIFDIVSPFRPPQEALMDSQVILEKADGEKTSFALKAGESILEAALRHNIQLPYSCNSGTCTTCSLDCTSGSVKMYTVGGPTDSRATRGTVFTCVGYPETAEVWLRLD